MNTFIFKSRFMELNERKALVKMVRICSCKKFSVLDIYRYENGKPVELNTKASTVSFNNTIEYNILLFNNRFPASI